MPIQKIYADRDYVEEKVQNKISTPETASKGQTIVVKTIDSNGKPNSRVRASPLHGYGRKAEG